MAFWQFSFWAIPEESIRKKYNKIPKEISEIDFNSINWFDNFSESIFMETIDYLLPSSHWCKSVIFFGEYESDSIAIDYEKNNLCEIYFRIDLRNDYEKMVKKMMNSIKKGHLIMLDEDLKVIDGNLDSFIFSLRHLCNQKNEGIKPI